MDREPASGAQPEAAATLIAAFVQAAALLDEARLDALLDEMLALGSFERAMDTQVFPALRALGHAWERGEVSVAAEHAASHAVLRRLSAAFEAAGRPGARNPILVGLPPGSRHELGALAFATALRRRGLPVIYLGADVPVDAWVSTVRDTRARGIVLAIPTVRDRAPARQVVEAAAGIAPDLAVVVGGAAAVHARLPDSVIVLPNGLTSEAAAFERALVKRTD
jgi:methanogenic corrinoid protein MtbC1